jgi:hypothetical protein
MYSTNDYLFAQWKQTPCGVGSNQLCDASFTNSNAELVSNGSFTTNSTGWTLGTGVTRDGTNHRIQFPGTTLTNALQQAITVANGSVYVVTFTIGGMTGGYITPKIDGASGTPCFSAGTYAIPISSAGTTGLYFDTHLFDGWIDDISVKLHELQTPAGCWAWGNVGAGGAEQWSIISGSGKITKIGSQAAAFYGTINNLSYGGYYKLIFRVTGMTAGTIISEPTGWTTLTVSADGVYEQYFTAGGTYITFTASADFNGSISDIEVLNYNNAYTIILKDTKNNTEADLSGDIELYEDYVTLKYQLGDVDPGCYELCVYDACGYNVNTPLLTDPSFNQIYDWLLDKQGTNDTLTISAGKIIYNTGTSGASGFNATNLGAAGYWTGKSVKVISWSFTCGTVDYTGVTTIGFSDNNGDFHTLYTGTLSTGFTQSGSITLYDNQDQAYDPILSVALNTSQASKTVEFTSFNLDLTAYVPGQMTEYCSNCIEIIDYPDTEKCTQWVGGTNGSDAFGFHFDPTSPTPFQVGARVRSMMINPKYKGDFKKYTSASGYNTVTQANSSKIYTLLIDYTDEHTHDWLRVATASDILRIGAFTNTTAKYVNTDGDYSPEWPDNIGNWPAAQARVEVQPLTDTLYNNNAG